MTARPRFIACLDCRVVQCVVGEAWYTKGDDVVGAFVVELGKPVLHVYPTAVNVHLNVRYNQNVT